MSGYADIEKKRAAARRHVNAKIRRWRAAGACERCGVPIQRFRKCLGCRRDAMKHHRAWRDRQPARFCPNHPERRISYKAHSCRQCSTLKARTTKGNKTVPAVWQVLSQGGAWSMADLCARTGFSHPCVTTALRHLEAQGVTLAAEVPPGARGPRYRLVRAA